MPEFDVVIVGSGPGGATAAEALTDAGKSVCLLEKGRNHLLALEPPFAALGHISSDEIKFGRRHFLGPDPLLEPRSYRRGVADGDRLFAGECNNMPSTLGGAGYHADGKLPRLREVDFRLASEHGAVDGADIADWPLDYDELEPFYADAERIIGVAGDHTGNPFAAWRSGPYPMPPGADMFLTTLTVPAAERRGYHPYRAPTGANSVPYDGRPACNNCGFCAFYGCPIEAKGDPVAPLRRALQSGRCDVRPESIAVEIMVDATGKKARGVRFLDADARATEVEADAVVVACGAFETPRLLLRSGIGNASDRVGRCLMFHIQTLVLGYFAVRLHAYKGRDVTHLMDDPIVGDDASAAAARNVGLPFLRGGIVEHGGSGHPIMEAIYTPAGAEHSARMAESAQRDKMAAFTMQGEDLPQLTNRVDLDPSLRDVWRLPSGRVTYTSHAHDVACAQHWGPRLTAVMSDAGAQHALWLTSPGSPETIAPDLAPISRHWMGTARMGTDPAVSVCDPWQRLWDVDNVVIADSSVFPTSSGYGPTLTIVALALRAARVGRVVVSVPFFTSLRGYDKSWLRGDLIAGLTVWAVLVPEALAYASIAGVSPVIGLYAAPPALILYAAFGSSRHLVVGPMAATAALSAAAVADLVSDPSDVAAFTTAVALMTGVLALAAGLLRLGFLANFISEPVLKGFIIGLALTIMIGQVPKLFGVEGSDGDFFRQLWDFLGNVSDAQWRTTLIGLGSLALVLLLKRFAPVIPASLVAVLLGVILVKLFDLDSKGVAIVGHIDSGLPSFGTPDAIGINDYFATAASSVGIMLVGFAEGLGAAKTYATRDHYEIDANRELLGLGAANIGSGLASGMVVNGSLSKTAVNAGGGARTQVSGLFVAAMTVVTLLFLTALFEDLPEATLAAVVIAALVELVDVPALAELYRLYTTRLGTIYGPAARPDFIAATAAMFGVLLFDTLPGLFIGIAVSLLLLLYRTSRPNVSELGLVPGTSGQFADRSRHPENITSPGVTILRVESGLFFGNADDVRAVIRAHAAAPDVHAVILDAETIPFVDITAVRMLHALAADLATSHVQLAMAHEIGQVRDVIRREDASELGIAVYPTVKAALDALRSG